MENMYIDVRVLRFEVFDFPNLLKTFERLFVWHRDNKSSVAVLTTGCVGSSVDHIIVDM